LQDAQNGEPSSAIKSYASEDDLCRVILTSGTTGGAKAVPYGLKVLAERLPTMNTYWSAGRNEMNLMGLRTVGGFLTALNSSYIGETYYCPPPDDFVKCANHFKITSLIGSPLQLADFVKRVELSTDGIPPVQEIRAAGGILPQALVHQLWGLFHAKIYNVYGSTEVGGVCCDLVKQSQPPDVAGWVLPIAEVQSSMSLINLSRLARRALSAPRQQVWRTSTSTILRIPPNSSKMAGFIRVTGGA
jgi:acyl-coenzyme A synthetase/AMP-(fatty) acid ligase